SDHGTVAWAKDATVIHRANIHLEEVAGKLAQAGQETAPLFYSRHPSAYRRLGYAAIDSRIRRWLWPLGRFLGPPTLRAAKHLEPLLDRPWMPYPLAR